MATALGLALKITADVGGINTAMTGVEKAFQQLGTQADAVTGTLGKFAAGNAAAAAEQEKLATAFAFLTSALKTGQISAQEFAAEFELLKASAGDTAAIFAAGAATTATYATEAQKAAAAIAEVNAQFAAGAIGPETQEAAIAKLSGATAKAAEDAAKLASAIEAGAATTAKYATDAEKAAAAQAFVNGQLAAGTIGLETHTRATADLSGATAKAAEDAATLASAIAAGAATTAKYATDAEKAAAAQAVLNEQLAAGTISPETAARATAELSGENAKAAEEAAKLASAMAAGAATTAKYASESDKNAAAMAEVNKQLAEGSITIATHNAALRELSGANAAAKEEAKQLADAEKYASDIMDKINGPTKAYDAALIKLNAAMNAGRLSQEAYDKTLGQITNDFIKAQTAANNYGKATEQAGSSSGLKLNELSGALGLLPGSLGSVSAKFSATMSAGEGLAKVFGGGGGIAGAMTSLGPIAAQLLNPFTLIAGGFLAAGAAASAVSAALDALSAKNERLTQIADKSGASFEYIQVLGKAAENAGSSVESVSGAFTKTLKAIDGANQGSKDSIENFARLGITTDDLRNKKPDEIFAQASEALLKITDPAKQASVAMGVFGKAGADLIPTLKGVADAGTDMKRFQATLTELDKTNLAALNKSAASTKTGFEGLGNALVLPFVGLKTGLNDAVSSILAGLIAIIKPIGRLLEPVFTAIGKSIAAVASFIGGILEEIGAWIDYFVPKVNDIEIKPIEIPVEINPPARPVAEVFQKELEAAGQAAGEFGQEGFKAMEAYNKSLEDIAAAAESASKNSSDITYSTEQTAKATANATAEFNKQIEVLKANKKAAEDAAKEQEKLSAAAAKAADDFMMSQGISGTAEEAKNKETLVAVNRAIADTENALAKAREQNDAVSEKALVKRLALLDQGQAAARQQDEFGFTQQDATKSIEKVRAGVEDALKEAINYGGDGIAAAAAFTTELEKLSSDLKLNLIDKDQFEEASKKLVEFTNKRIALAKQVNDLENKYAEELRNQQDERVKELSTVSKEKPQANDVRTTEGAALVMQIAQGGQDPAIEEYRKQLKKLDELKKEITKMRIIQKVGIA